MSPKVSKTEFCHLLYLLSWVLFPASCPLTLEARIEPTKGTTKLVEPLVLTVKFSCYVKLGTTPNPNVPLHLPD
jgi:hypothetical protein